MAQFKLTTEQTPAGDQPQAIKKLLAGLSKDFRLQTLLGATGTGKTFTMANIIQKIQKPTLVIAHNKTLAAQLAQEFKRYFPENAVHYFVSYYDYYQPEAYLPTTDTFIEKDAQINKEIDRLRHASTQSLLTRNDVIIVASVSCIYGLGSPEEYQKINMKLAVGQTMSRSELMNRIVDLHFERTNADLSPGQFRAIGNTVEIMPMSEITQYAISFSGTNIGSIIEINPVSSEIRGNHEAIFVFPAKHFVTAEEDQKRAMKTIKSELNSRLKEFQKEKKVLEYERLKRRTTYDLAMIREIGYCSGIENYSRHFSGHAPGQPPDTLISYFPRKLQAESFKLKGETSKKLTANSLNLEADFLTIIDESHVTIPQLGGMFAGDQSRKNTLVEHGFRLPSAKDNRPLRFEEFLDRVGQVICTTATPGNYEREQSSQIVEQIIRPTGLVDPILDVRPVMAQLEASYPGQVQNFITEAVTEIKKGGRVLATTLTKKMAEDLAAYLKERNIRAEYLHSDVETLDRIKILTQLRKGEFDCLVGVNLLREGLDLPEVTLIGILDADKEGFLRSETALIQTIGRAARNVDGRVILYADNMTGSLERAIAETNRRREKQLAYNKEHNITPTTIIKAIKDITDEMESEHKKTAEMELALELATLVEMDAKAPGRARKTKQDPLQKLISLKEDEMKQAVKSLDFETAAVLRDEIKYLNEKKGK